MLEGTLRDVDLIYSRHEMVVQQFALPVIRPEYGLYVLCVLINFTIFCTVVTQGKAAQVTSWIQS